MTNEETINEVMDLLRKGKIDTSTTNESVWEMVLGRTFEVSRTSDLWDDKQPCDEAMKADGKWFIHIKDMNELMSFIAKYGKIVLREKSIEIYDSYRE